MRRHMGKKSYRLANTEEVQEMQETSNTRNVKGGKKKTNTELQTQRVQVKTRL